MSSSIHDKLNRVRKPRVHITYDVETEGAQIERELPFVVGVMGDFSGDPTTPLKPMADRKFTQIDRDNFNDVMASMAPGLKLKVDNKLADDGTQMAVDLNFKSMDDFDPARVVAARCFPRPHPGRAPLLGSQAACRQRANARSARLPRRVKHCLFQR